MTIDFNSILNGIQIIATIVSPILLTIIGIIATKNNNLQMQLNEKKRETYLGFIELLQQALNNQRGASNDEKKKAEIQKNLEEGIFMFRKQLIVYSSPKSIKAFNKWTLASSTASKDTVDIETFRNLENLIRSLREEIGLSNRGLDELDILQVYVKDDLKQYLKTSRKTTNIKTSSE